MQNIIKTFWAFVITLLFSTASYAQDTLNFPLILGKIEPYKLEVTYDKTTHLIFPSSIRYVDLGSEYLIASKAEDAENVLRIKATTRDFEAETNFSVITKEGCFYNFNVIYNDEPEALSYDLNKLQKTKDKTENNPILFEELGTNSPSLVHLLLETIYKNNKRTIKHLGSKSFGIQFTMKGLYIHNGNYYVHLESKNKTSVPFQIDFMTFKKVDKKIAKRTAIQEKTIIPKTIYKPLTEIPSQSIDRNIFLLEAFTIADDKVLIIELFEKNGGRHQSFQVENTDLAKATLIDQMHLIL
ncbi:conjugative transposon protein TraN [Flavobacterium sp. xlx-214]|uniref:conjugative transposon protein TraN n=1 Tax=unclassified Flavobacterium TaxID=196869 RepID=UPI0013D2BCBB|nr:MULTISPECIES: conjugative transposon protein TraN [unclassified Flavobacterium]MBA5793479.1 conjugative transposon protein TraN [Flavobacterium sp. xlx-221]QMI82750.1 conjugative transposon protein TraN [Flavobacterium sp. xlx-214]